jgi:hypothetical protein
MVSFIGIFIAMASSLLMEGLMVVMDGPLDHWWSYKMRGGQLMPPRDRSMEWYNKSHRLIPNILPSFKLAYPNWTK